jgi:aminopeptidase N
MNRLIRRLLISLALFLLLVGGVAAQRRERSVDTWQPLHYEVSIALDEQLSELASARTVITARVLGSGLEKIDLDFGELPIDSVLISGKPAPFQRTSDLLSITLLRPSRRDEQLTITVNYHGHPKDGLIFAKDRDGRTSVTGDNWPNRVHQWIPCLDHPSAKATVAFTVTAPNRELVVANGSLVNQSAGDAKTVWKFDESKPIPPYCMVVAVNEGAQIQPSGSSLTPLFYYVAQRDRAYAATGFAGAGPAVALFSETIAPYPYEKLALIVGATRFGGMENSSAIVFTSTLFDLRGNEPMSGHFRIPTRIEDVVAHEIAHQWFGDSVTESTWADLWLSEGFATYFAGIFIEKYEGESQFRTYMRDAAARSLAYEKQRNAPIHDADTPDLMKLLNPNNYEKGAWVLHMLRKRLGDQAFFRGLRDYYKEHAHANATTEDLRRALEGASHSDLKEFFARWVYDSGHPIYELTWGSMESRAAASIEFQLNQLQQGAAFLDPVPVEFTVNGQPHKETIYPKGKVTTVNFHLDAAPTAVKIDPDETLLREIITKS